MTDNIGTQEPTHDKIDLINSVSRRLFIAFIVLLVLVLIVVISSTLIKHISVSFIVIPTGIIGGFVGLQRRLKQLSTNDLQLINRSWLYTFLAPLVGGILALLLFVLFLSGLLEGDLFPKFVGQDVTPTGFTDLLKTQAQQIADYAKLIFWSFIAGYSEHFVTDIIGKFEQKGK